MVLRLFIVHHSIYQRVDVMWHEAPMIRLFDACVNILFEIWHMNFRQSMCKWRHARLIAAYCYE